MLTEVILSGKRLMNLVILHSGKGAYQAGTNKVSLAAPVLSRPQFRWPKREGFAADSRTPKDKSNF